MNKKRNVFSQFLKEKRKELHLTQVELAVKAGVGLRFVRDVEQGKKAYHFLNRSAMRLVEDNGIFVTSSCSHFLTEEDMAFILRRASIQNGINLTILNIIRQSSDHPQSVYFPESS